MLHLSLARKTKQIIISSDSFQASKLLSHIVDVYAKNVNIPMVQKMTFGVFKLPGSVSPFKIDL